LAVAGLVLEYGFLKQDQVTGLTIRVSPLPIQVIDGGQFLAAAVFALVVWVELMRSAAKRAYVKDQLLELVLGAVVLLGLAAILICPAAFSPRERIAATYGCQIYLLLQLISIFVRLNSLFVRSILHPLRGIVTSFVVLIIIGALLLSLPAASYRQRFADWPNNFADHLFTATSAVCVTGLIVRDTGSDYTPFGQLVILALIQSGGLGIVIFGTIFALLVGRQITLREATAVQDLYSQQALGQVRRMVIFIVISTLIIEGIGAVMMLGLWNNPGISSPQRVFKSIFHAVSAYCNAGFSLQRDSMVSFARSWQTHVVMMPLILIGGLGFPVLLNIAQVAKCRVADLLGLSKRPGDLDRHRLVTTTLQTKIVLASTAILVIAGAAAIFIMETPRDRLRWARKVQYEDVAMDKENTMNKHSPSQRLLDAVFQSVSARTAGFNTVDTSSGNLSSSTLLVLIALMFIGGSPASTAGGIKTVTFALLLAAVAATLRQRPNVEMFKRTIAPVLIRRAMAVALLFLILVWLVGLTLVMTHPQMNSLELLFEATSACGTVGYSTGITPHLNLVGRICIIVAMFAGRLGPLTLLFALTKPGKTIRYDYPRENVVTG